MITIELVNKVKEAFAKYNSDLELTYRDFKERLSAKEVYDICIGKAEVSDELPKEDLVGNRLNPFLYRKDDDLSERLTFVKRNDEFTIKSGVDNPVTEEVVEKKPEPVNMIDTVKESSSLNYESVGFAIGFKNASAEELLEMANGNALRLIPALQWLYAQTNEDGLRNRIKELTLGVLFK